MKPVFIINPKALGGGNSSIERHLIRAFADCDVRILHTQRPGHATELAREAVANGEDTVIAVGGDGTVNEVLNGLIGSNVFLGVIPAGTANDLARHHGIPMGTRAACEVIRRQCTHSVDVIRVNDWHFLTVGGLGLPCDAISALASFRDGTLLGRALTMTLGSGIYLLALLHAVARGGLGHQIQIQSGNNRLASIALSVTLGNQPTLGRHFQVSPGAITNDGLVDLCVIDGNTGPLQFLVTLILVLMGRHVARRGVTTLRTCRATIRTTQPVSFFGDGQFTAVADRFDIRVMPGAVSLIVPSGKRG